MQPSPWPRRQRSQPDWETIAFSIVGLAGIVAIFVAAALVDPFVSSGGSFTATGSMSVPREAHTATLLQDGSVLITGGRGGLGDESSAELFHPGTGRFERTGEMHWRRRDHTATLLPDGRVLIAGGGVGQAELYDPRTRAFSLTGAVVGESDYGTATLLRNGRVLLAASSRSTDADLYDPATGIFTATGPMAGYCAGEAVLLRDGRVLRGLQ